MRAITRNGILTRTGMPLSKRETEIAELVAKGLSNQQIAYELGLAESTVKAHLASVFAKLQIHNRVQLTLVIHDRNHV
jgi:DNA-binding NarL/FixJ family response regulator